MKIVITFDNDEQRKLLERFIPAGIETDGVTTDDIGLVRRILVFLRIINRQELRKSA